MLNDRRVAQIAYFVSDIRESAKQHSVLFGSGPFFAVDHIKFSFSKYRGIESEFCHSSALGQHGDLMIEFMQQDRPGPSSLTDVFPEGSGRYGTHHHAIMVDDPKAVAAEFAQKGYEIALHGELTNGIELYHIDTTGLYGHMIELYAPTKTLIDVYDFIRDQAVGFDGSDPVRTLSLD